MDPATAVLIASSALQIFKQVAPIVQGYLKDGQISAEDQQKLLDAYNSIEADFALPEYQKQA